MKKKKVALLILIFVLCLAGGIIAFLFFGKKQPNIITVEGQKYDLSKDLQEVVGKMVSDDIKIGRPSGRYQLYDEDGKFINGSGGLINAGDIFAEERDRTDSFHSDIAEEMIEEHGNLISKVFYFYDMESNEIRSDFGISSIEDIKKLDSDTFIKTDSPIQLGCDYGYTAVFVNGKPLDFSDYEKQLDELKEVEHSANLTIGGVLMKFTPHHQAFGTRFNSDFFRTCHTYEELEEIFEIHSNSLDEDLLILFAMEDAYQQLEDEEAKFFTVVTFGVDEEEKTVNMYYNEFYFDENWDQKKFLPDAE